MNTSAMAVEFDADSMHVHLDDGRVLSVPLSWFPRWLAASAGELAQFELSPSGIHWDVLDEDISIEGLLAGRRDLTRGAVSAAS